MLAKQKEIVCALLFFRSKIPVTGFDLQRFFKKGSLEIPGLAVRNIAQVVEASGLILKRIQAKIFYS